LEEGQEREAEEAEEAEEAGRRTCLWWGPVASPSQVKGAQIRFRFHCHSFLKEGKRRRRREEEENKGEGGGRREEEEEEEERK